MNKIILFFVLFPLFSIAQKQNDSIWAESLLFQKHINTEYSNKEESPLTESDFGTFEGLPFYEIDSTFYVLARFEKAKKSKSVKFKTSTDRRPVYEIYGKVFFTIHDTQFSLNIYQSHRLRNQEEFKNHLFLPFMDLTNGKTSYAGGRYIDLSIPTGKEIVINFNTAYNPYCAYSSRYSCPVVPDVNFIKVEINAGVQAPKKH